MDMDKLPKGVAPATPEQREAMILSAHALTFAVDLAMGQCFELLETLPKYPALYRHEVKMHAKALRRCIEAYNRGVTRDFGEFLDDLAEYNEILEGKAGNAVEMLRLAQLSMFRGRGDPNAALHAKAEVAVGVTDIADATFGYVRKIARRNGLIDPVRYLATLNPRNADIAVTRLCNAIHAADGIRKLNVTADRAVVGAFNALLRLMQDGDMMEDAMITAGMVKLKNDGDERREVGA